VPVKDILANQSQVHPLSGRVVHDAGSQTGRARAEAAQRMGALGAGRTRGGSCCQWHGPAWTDTPRLSQAETALSVPAPNGPEQVQGRPGLAISRGPGANGS
jgi:hypothetical protein